jgi:RNA polymerase sigma factor (sigma-70 family)
LNDVPDSNVPAFQAVFREHYPRVVRKLQQLIGDRGAAEDLAQEVFLKLYRQPPDDLNRIGAWLHRVLTTTGYDYLRQRSRRKTLQAKEEAQLGVSDQAVPSNEQLMLESWEKELVKRALHRLSERDREALLLKQQGYSYNEIADRIGVRPAVVGSLLSRAEDRLRRHYFQEEGVVQ